MHNMLQRKMHKIICNSKYNIFWFLNMKRENMHRASWIFVNITFFHNISVKTELIITNFISATIEVLFLTRVQITVLTVC